MISGRFEKQMHKPPQSKGRSNQRPKLGTGGRSKMKGYKGRGGHGTGRVTEVVTFQNVWKPYMENLTERCAVTIKVKKVEIMLEDRNTHRGLVFVAIPSTSFSTTFQRVVNLRC